MVFPAKYRRAVFDVSVDQVLREICLEIEKRYQIKFLEIGVDEDHVHFLVQSVLSLSIKKGPVNCTKKEPLYLKIFMPYYLQIYSY